MRRVIVIALGLEVALLLALTWFFWHLANDVLPADAPPVAARELFPRTASVLAYIGLLLPVIVYSWRGSLPASLLPRCLVIAAALPVTLTQLVLPFILDDGLEDSALLWGFSVALGVAYMLNRDLLAAPKAVSEA